jgi:hypothetical protein
MAAWLTAPKLVSQPTYHQPSGNPSAPLLCIKPTWLHGPPLRPQQTRGREEDCCSKGLHLLCTGEHPSPLQAIAVRVHLPKLCFTLCSVYLSPAITRCSADMTNLISQLSPPPQPFILLGGFNARNIPWGAFLTAERVSLSWRRDIRHALWWCALHLYCFGYNLIRTGHIDVTYTF